MQPYNENFMPGSLTGKLSLMHMPAPMTGYLPQRPQAGRSKMLADLMAMKTGPGVSDYTTGAATAGVGLMDAYKTYNKEGPDGIAENKDAVDARRNAGIATGAGALGTAAGALIPGWGGRIAQLAGLMASEYGKQKSSDAEGQAMRAILAEPDAEKRARMALLYRGK